MKHTIHTPTGDFAYVETEFESGKDNIEEAAIFHQVTIGALNRGGIGLDKKEFDRCIDEYLGTGTIKDGASLYPKMNLEQQNIIQTIKRSFKRKNYDVPSNGD